MSLLNTGQVYYINSANRVSGTSSNFIATLTPWDPNSDALYDRIVCLQATVPKSYYLVQPGHNTFTLTENGVDHTVTLTPGNYGFGSNQAIDTALTNALNNSTGSWTYSCGLSLSTGKLTFAVTGNGGLQPSFTFPVRVDPTDGTDLILPGIMGFTPGTVTFSADSLVSTNVCQLQLSSNLLISSPSHAENSVLQDISGASVDFSVINFQQRTPDFYARKLANGTSNQIQIVVTDYRTGQILDLNGLDISVTICLFKHNSFYRTAVNRWLIEDNLAE